MRFELEKLLHKEGKSPYCWKSKAPRGGNCRAGFICHDHLDRQFESKKKRAEAYGLPESTIDFRLKSGWTLEEALTVPRFGPRNRQRGIKGVRNAR